MNQTFETPGRLQLEMRVPAGRIRIRAVETTQTMLSISGGRSPEDFRIAFDDVRAGEHHLTVEYRERGKLFGWKGDELRVDVTVPLGTDVSCETGSADLEISGRISSLQSRTGSGDLGFDQVDGDVNVKGASGDMSGTTVGGALTFTSASGDVRIREVSGEVGGKTASGDIELGSVGGSVRLTVVSGDVEIGSVGSGSTNVRSVSGDVEIGVARRTRAYLDVSSTSGDTVSELDMSDTSDGGADLELQVNTVSGDVRIFRSTEVPSAGS